MQPRNPASAVLPTLSHADMNQDLMTQMQAMRIIRRQRMADLERLNSVAVRFMVRWQRGGEERHSIARTGRNTLRRNKVSGSKHLLNNRWRLQLTF